MTKTELSARAARRLGLSKGETNGAVNALFEAMREALESGETVSIAGFGTFSVRERAARRGRNPRTGESIAIGASKAPVFKAAKALRNAVR